ncbi:MAG: rRNA maturation RNase YbeY [Dehalococcoidales bacterium]|nr:rRNA maturation RNase YbeY [Dehalococcoidales bacterium]
MMIDMEINVLIDESLEGCLEVGWLQSVAKQVLVAQEAGAGVEMGLVIASQERVRQLNRNYRGRDEPTDVLAFSMLLGEEMPETDFPPFVMPPDGVLHLGEVIISYPQAVIQAEEHQHSIEKEITILIIHGVLHLLGYKHDTPELKRQMMTREAEILSYVEGESKRGEASLP